jgi:gamma-glutamyltranspeptidase/glutathione hydrolase/leukotriene-C4 hydrolase
MAPKGVILKEGDIIKRIALSKTLQAIADEGADVFYKGWIADSLVEVIQNNSGIITKQGKILSLFRFSGL